MVMLEALFAAFLFIGLGLAGWWHICRTGRRINPQEPLDNKEGLIKKLMELETLASADSREVIAKANILFYGDGNNLFELLELALSRGWRVTGTTRNVKAIGAIHIIWENPEKKKKVAP